MLTQTLNSIRKGVRVFCPRQENIAESKLLLSSGTTQDIELEYVSDIAYRSDAFLPTQTWRTPHWEERSTIFTADPNPPLFEQYRRSSLGVIQIPSNVLAPMIDILEELELRSLSQKRFDELAYVAPTDNLIHDASSMGKRDPDITWTAVGYFGCSASTRGCV